MIFMHLHTDTAATHGAGNSLTAIQLLRKRLTASHVNEAMRRSMLRTLFATFAAFLQVAPHHLQHVPHCIATAQGDIADPVLLLPGRMHTAPHYG